MSLFDRFLLIIALGCVFSITLIFASADSEVEVPASESKEDMIVYSQEVDAAIEQYFENIRNHPEQVEEENRIINSEDLSQDNVKDDQAEKPKAVKKASLAEDKRFRIIEHTVRPGESVWRIAQKYGVPVYTIISANPKKAQKIIQPKDVLKIPSKKGVFHKVRRGETLSAIASRYKSSITPIKKMNEIAGSTILIGQEIFIPNAKPLPTIHYVKKNRFLWPIRGRITSRYGWRYHPISKKKHFHSGVDIAAKRGVKVRAAAKGVVVFSGKSGGYGKTVILRHADGYFTVYAHMSSILVRKGKAILRGQYVGRVGSTGVSTGPHLHFEIKRYKKNINPFVAMKKTIKVATKIN